MDRHTKKNTQFYNSNTPLNFLCAFAKHFKRQLLASLFTSVPVEDLV